MKSSEWKYQKAMKSGQWKGLASNEKWYGKGQINPTYTPTTLPITHVGFQTLDNH